MSLRAKSKEVRERLNQYYRDKKEEQQYEFNACKFQSQETISEHQGSEEAEPMNQVIRNNPR